MASGSYMIREIREGPAAFRETLGALGDIDSLSGEIVSRYRRIVTCSSGTSHHAGLSLSYAASRLAEVESFSTLSSEYSEHVHNFLRRDHLMIAISQSGESVDTLRAARLASEKGVDVLAISGSRGSSLGSLARYFVEARSGVERAVPATKSFMAQLAAAYSLALGLATARGIGGELEEARKELSRQPQVLQQAIELLEPFAERLSKELSGKEHVFVLGYGPSYIAALEAALKLKETCRLHAEAYSVREFRHGPISLLSSHAACVLIIPPEPGDTLEIFDKVASTARSAGALTIILSHLEWAGLASDILLPMTKHVFASAVEVVLFQLLAYYTALEKSLDPDSPPLLSKIVRQP
ncbi:MAG: SIS domain-containing protein [Nitrososphaerota archaeon]